MYCDVKASKKGTGAIYKEEKRRQQDGKSSWGLENLSCSKCLNWKKSSQLNSCHRVSLRRETRGFEIAFAIIFLWAKIPEKLYIQITTSFFLPQFDVIYDLLLNRPRQHGIYCERFEPRSHFKSRVSLIVRVNVVLNRTVVVDTDWRFDNLCRSHLQLRVRFMEPIIQQTSKWRDGGTICFCLSVASANLTFWRHFYGQ